MKRGLILFWLVLALLPIVAFAAPSARAWLDRQTMQLGETVTLNVEIEDNAGGEPDFNALLEDFRSLGTQSSRQISVLNGTSTAKTIWAIALEPKRAGTLTIPAFTIGTAMTAPLSLVVEPVQQGAPGKTDDTVFIEVSANPHSPYVQQQVQYTVKLYYAVDLTEGALDEPAAPGLVVKKLGRDKQYNAMVGERRYHVLERQYALIGEQSGAVTVPAISFRGSALDSSDPTGFFRRGRAISARSPELQLDVRAKPATWKASAWLPAASLGLSDETPLPSEARVGEPITRTLRLRAQGLGFEQLPDIEIKTPDGTEIYPDKPDTQTRDDGSWLYGERTRKFAIVPTRPGKLVLPEIEVQWWDTVQDRLASAVLPAHTIDVLPAAGARDNATLDTGAVASDAGSSDRSAPSIVYPGDFDVPVKRWRALALIAFAGWIGTLFFWWRTRHSPIALPAHKPPSATVAGRAGFLRACSLGDLAGAEHGLLAWARSERSDVRNLGEVIAQIDSEAQRDALGDLQRARFAGGSTDGLATRLSRAFGHGFTWRSEDAIDGDTSVLPPLYPTRR